MDEALYDLTHSQATMHWWYQGRSAILRRVLGRYLSVDQSVEFLEIGAGAGVNIPMLKEFGAVSAVEMNADGRRAISQEHPDVTVRDGALPDAEVFGDQTYDAVGMFDVLEHIEDDCEALVAVRKHMNAGGKLFLTVPAYQWMWTRHDDVNHHYRRYSKARLSSVMQRAGWKIEQVGYFNTFLFPLAVLARARDKFLPGEVTTGLNTPPGVINGSLLALFRAEAGIVAGGGFPFGLSLMAVATPGESL